MAVVSVVVLVVEMRIMAGNGLKVLRRDKNIADVNRLAKRKQTVTRTVGRRHSASPWELPVGIYQAADDE
jgi:hypothetical protein